MIKCVDGNGQGCCWLCSIIKGWHREWSSSLYYVINNKGKYLRYLNPDYSFSDNDVYRKVVFCYSHAVLVDESRSKMTDYDK